MKSLPPLKPRASIGVSGRRLLDPFLRMLATKSITWRSLQCILDRLDDVVEIASSLVDMKVCNAQDKRVDSRG